MAFHLLLDRLRQSPPRPACRHQRRDLSDRRPYARTTRPTTPQPHPPRSLHAAHNCRRRTATPHPPLVHGPPRPPPPPPRAPPRHQRHRRLPRPLPSLPRPPSHPPTPPSLSR